MPAVELDLRKPSAPRQAGRQARKHPCPEESSRQRTVGCKKQTARAQVGEEFGARS